MEGWREVWVLGLKCMGFNFDFFIFGYRIIIFISLILIRFFRFN